MNNIRYNWSPINSTHLNPGLGDVEFESDVFPHEDIGVSRLVEQILENLELCPGVGGPFSASLRHTWGEFDNIN